MKTASVDLQVFAVTFVRKGFTVTLLGRLVPSGPAGPVSVTATSTSARRGAAIAEPANV